MHTTRIALTAGLSLAVVAAALVACSRSRDAATPIDPVPVSDGVAATSGRSPDVRANEDPQTFRRIPARFRWVGEEHNRLLNRALRQLATARDNDPVAYRRMKRDCAWAFAAIGDDIEASAVRGGFASQRAEALRAGRAGVAHLPRCQGTMAPSMALFAAPFASFAQPRGDDDEISDATIAVLSALIADLEAAATPADIDAAIARASNAAAGLPMGQSDVVWAAASLTAGSAGYWSNADMSPYAMTLFAFETSSWGRFKAVVTADAVGCAGFLTSLGRMPFPWQVKIAGCLITGAVASVFAI
jgi:hypothetical protein